MRHSIDLAMTGRSSDSRQYVAIRTETTSRCLTITRPESLGFGPRLVGQPNPLKNVLELPSIGRSMIGSSNQCHRNLFSRSSPCKCKSKV